MTRFSKIWSHCQFVCSLGTNKRSVYYLFVPSTATANYSEKKFLLQQLKIWNVLWKSFEAEKGLKIGKWIKIKSILPKIFKLHFEQKVPSALSHSLYLYLSLSLSHTHTNTQFQALTHSLEKTTDLFQTTHAKISFRRLKLFSEAFHLRCSVNSTALLMEK